MTKFRIEETVESLMLVMISKSIKVRVTLGEGRHEGAIASGYLNGFYCLFVLLIHFMNGSWATIIETCWKKVK